MRLKCISCDVFLREVCYYTARSRCTIDLEFTELGAHDRSDDLRRILQGKIDALRQASVRYDAIVLCYGLCGNALAGITARDIPLVLPRAHDCCTILLGSKSAFQRHFGDNPSRPFSSPGYIERCATHLREEDVVKIEGKTYTYNQFVDLYGEENARYLFDQLKGASVKLDNTVTYIEMPAFRRLGFRELFERTAKQQNRKMAALRGSGRLIRNLLNGIWPSCNFCNVAPGERIEPVYDLNEVVRTTTGESSQA